MKLLFDHNLSPRLIHRLSDQFPDCSHVLFHGLGEADDRQVWDLARAEGYTLVTKDSDFSDLAILRGSPPKVIWLRIGNCTTTQVEELMRRDFEAVREFLSDNSAGVLALL